MPSAMSLASSPINKLDKNRDSFYKQLTRKSLACVLSTSTLSPIKSQENKLSMTQDDLLEISYYIKILDNKRR
ncbi:hypothetical protein SteCoe_11474 [Stentor coeruleus]|uniref:Uncharacterized protein n=1 Tax=Stentor coeruleus TaxID=5963 RepID=A0A1R2CD37_9CILI|nr:hypothetical protein SteCoe_11474 [Stentor coeruleus]